MKRQPIISVVIGSYNRLPFLKLAIASVRADLLAFETSEIIVVDGGSDDGSIAWLAEQKDIILIVQHNRGQWCGKPIKRRSWGYFMNLAFKTAQGKFICMLSDDCLLVPASLEKGVKLFESELERQHKIGAVAFYWRNWPIQEKYWVGITLGRRMFVNHGLYLRSALSHIGFLDEDTYQFYHADGDVCLRMAEAGWLCIDSPGSIVEHLAHGYNPDTGSLDIRASNLSSQPEDWAKYLSRWSYLNSAEEPNFEGDWKYCDQVDPLETFRGFQLAFEDLSQRDTTIHDRTRSVAGMLSITVRRSWKLINTQLGLIPFANRLHSRTLRRK